MSDLAVEIRELIDETMSNSERSQFAHRALGVSDVGHCHEYARRIIVGSQQEKEQESYLAAFVGTAVGDSLEQAYLRQHPDALIQTEVTVDLQIEDYILKLPGHPDIIHDNRVIDWKTKDGLGVVRSQGATLQEQFQVSLYTKAAIKAGLVNEDCLCTLIYVDRSGGEPDPVVVEWLYDEGLVREAEEWLSDVVYAVLHDETAQKDKPRTWCWACCPFAPSCRGDDTDVEGLIEDEEVLQAVKSLTEARQHIRQWEGVKKAATATLANVTGSTGDQTIRWVSIPGGHVEYDRSSYWKLDVSPVRARRVR